MATYIIHGETGNDSNAGTSAATPLKTLNGLPALASGDTVSLAENIRSSSGGAATLTITGLTGVTFQQESGGTQAWLCGDVLIGNASGSGGRTWANTSGTKWTKTIATGLTLGGVAFKWLASTTTSGHHYGWLVSAAGAGSSGQYEYVSGTGVLTINVPSSPNTSAEDVTYSVSDAAPAALYFVGGSGNSVTGLKFRNYSAAGQYGWAVRFAGSGDGYVGSCTAWDMGPHVFGCIGDTAADNSGCVVEDCTSYSVSPDGTHIIFHQDTSGGNLSGCIARGCTIHGRRRLDITQAALSGLAANSQVGVKSHTSFDSGSGKVADVLADQCTFVAYAGDEFFTPVSGTGADQVVPGNLWLWSSFAVRVDRCTFQNFSVIYTEDYLAIRRSYVQLLRDTSSRAARGMFNVTGQLLLEASEFIYNSNAGVIGGFHVNVLAQASGSVLNCLNTSFYNSSAVSGEYLFQMNYTTSGLGLHGCAFGGAASMYLLANDQSGAVLDILDNAYHNTAGRQESHPGETIAQFIAAVDTSGVALASAPFLSAPTDLSLAAASPLWSDRRATSTYVPANGINAPYTDFYGAYQYGPLPLTAAISADGLYLTITWADTVNVLGVYAPSTTNGVSHTSEYYSGNGTTSTVWLLDGAVLAGETITVTVPASTAEDLYGVDNGAATLTATNGSTVYGVCGGKAARLLRNSCTVQRRTTTQSSTSAGAKQSWASAYSGVCCNIQGDNTAEAVQAFKETGRRMFRGYFPPSLAIYTGDRITAVTGCAGIASDDVLEMAGPSLDQAGVNEFQKVQLIEVKREGGTT